MIVKKSDDAVSPVIGVMLMIVIVVIIAAVVTAFATGMMSETEAAPVAALDVEILNSEATLSKGGVQLKGPELFITHRSGDAVDTKDIELQFSWVCGVADCASGGVHTSIYSADGFKKEHSSGLNTGSSGDRMQALYVKSTMAVERDEYGSIGINHYFGDVILTPGMKLTAQSELLDELNEDNPVNTASPFMEMVFNNYQNSIVQGTEESETYNSATVGESAANHRRTGKCSICYPAADAVENGGNGDGEAKSNEWNAYCNNPENWNKCESLKASKMCQHCNHTVDMCTGVNNPNNCGCYVYTPSTPGSDGIMDHLPAGTAVDVMIIHTPSGKAIYDKTVIVE